MRNLKNYYPAYIVVIVSTIFYFWTRFWRFSSGFICPLWEFDSFSDIGIIVVLTTSFVMSLILGIKNIYLKWLFPIIFATFVWVVPAVIYLLLHNQVNFYNFMYYTFYTFFILFIGVQIIASLGLGIGVLILKIRIRKK